VEHHIGDEPAASSLILKKVNNMFGDTDLMTAQSKTLAINRTMQLKPSQYISEKTEKSLIVLHFTAGTTAQSAFNSWATDARRVGTPYIVDRDGTVFEVFDPRCWAYALGVKDSAATSIERRALQIEIANVGPLKRKGEDLYWWPKDFGARYCGIGETGKYVHSAYRGFEYFATFTAQQELAVCALVKQLCEQFNIPKVLPEGKLIASDLAFFSKFKGIASHQNFRSDKFDVGPAFFWDELRTVLA